MLQYRFHINQLDRLVEVLPEFKDGVPKSFTFGSYSYDPQKNEGKVDYDSYKAKLLAELAVAKKTLPVEDWDTYKQVIRTWDGQEIVTEATNPVVKDPIEPDIPVPVSGEIRAKAKGIGDAGA